MVDFGYDRGWIMRSSLFLAVAVVWVMVLIVFLLPFDLFVAVVMGSTLTAFFIIIGISPFLTKHSIDRREIVLRQGWHFRIRIPLESVKAINLIDQALKDRSLFISQTRGTLNITSSKHNLISLKLRQPQRFASLFWRRADEIVFDVNDPEGFRKAFENELIVTRASPGRPFLIRP